MQIRLPKPPSVNAMFINRKHGTGRGRIKSKAYNAWIAEANVVLMNQWPRNRRKAFDYPVSVSLILPYRGNSDLDNFAKPLLDFLVAVGLLSNDTMAHVRHLEIRPTDREDVLITIERWNDENA